MATPYQSVSCECFLLPSGLQKCVRVVRTHIFADESWRCYMFGVREFLASFPFADSTKDAYGRVLSQLVTLPIVEMGAADLLQFVCRPEWGSNQRYTALAACRKFI